MASFLGTLCLLGALSLALPKPTVSEYERRELAAMPAFSVQELFWGDYLREVEAFYADGFPFRDRFVRAAARVDELRGFRVGGARLIETAPRQEEPPAADAAPPPDPATPATADATADDPATPEQVPGEADTPFRMVDDGGQGEQTENGIFLYGGRAMGIFGGSAAMGSRYAEALNLYAESFGEGVRTFNIVVPTAIEFYLPARYRTITNPQKPQIDHVYAELDGVIPVDAYTAIQNHAGEYLYFNTDHHWTGLGAYYAYTAFCAAAGWEPLSLDDFDRRTLEGEFLGTFYSQSYDSQLEDSADEVEYFVLPGEFEVFRYDRGAPDTPNPHSVWAEYAGGVNAYAVFLHGDYPLIHIKTEAANGRSVLLVKESFGNAFAPFLLAHYEEVYVVDQRYFEKELVPFVAEQGVDDVIFLNNAFAANTNVRIAELEELLGELAQSLSVNNVEEEEEEE